MSKALPDTNLTTGHGGQGSQEASYTRLLRKDVDYKPLVLSDPDDVLFKIATAMDQGEDPLKRTPEDNLPDEQENPYVPAGYTYLGQFIDHDLTLDTRSKHDAFGVGQSSFPDNERTPRLDLDCLYGEGPGSGAYMYDHDGRLLTNPDQPWDLPRARTLFDPGDPMSHRAIIGDPRNDENSIVCQLQLAFIKFHNALIDKFKKDGISNQQNARFLKARQEVRFTYQLIVVTDFLKRIINQEIYENFVKDFNAKGNSAFKLYKAGHLRAALPLEFTGAAYRFGHSGVRNSYRLNGTFQELVFVPKDDPSLSMVGFGDLPKEHEIDWSLFFSPAVAPGASGPNPSTIGKTPVAPDPKRLQYAYKIDTSLVNPLTVLPKRISGDDAGTKFASLAMRNLKRGYNFNLPSGQDIASVLGVTKHPPLRFGEQLLAFKKDADIDEIGGISDADRAALKAKTPLWLYILAEAQAVLATPDGTFDRKPDEKGVQKIKRDSNVGTQLGPVGGRILLEVFFGLLDSDEGSYFWETGWSPVIKPGAKALTMWDMLHFIGAV